MYSGSSITSVVDAAGCLKAFEDDATSGMWPNSSSSNITYDVYHNLMQPRSCKFKSNPQVDNFPEICYTSHHNDMFNTTQMENGIVITTDALFAEDTTVIPLYQDSTEESLNNVATDGRYCSSYNKDSVTTADRHGSCNNIPPNEAEAYCRSFYNEPSNPEETYRHSCNSISETTTNRHRRLFNKSPIITGEFYCPNNKVPTNRTGKYSFLPYNQVPSIFLKDMRTHTNSTNQTTIEVSCTKMSKSFKKRPICPIQLENKRALANKQERLRMYRLNTALEKLRQAIPESFQELWSYNKRRSKIRTLRLAICYITVLKDALQKCSGN